MRSDTALGWTKVYMYTPTRDRTPIRLHNFACFTWSHKITEGVFSRAGVYMYTLYTPNDIRWVTITRVVCEAW